MKGWAIFGYFSLFILSIFTFEAAGQTSLASKGHQPLLPVVFDLDDHENQYEGMKTNYGSLLDVCQGDMSAGRSKIISMMKEMEGYAASVGYDLKDINAWMHFFFRPDGSIEHIGFHLKPQSKNINLEDFKAFLAGFTREYKFPVAASAKFAQFCSFSFPLVNVAHAAPATLNAKNIADKKNGGGGQ